jgi:hypothetical protein
VVKWPQRNLVNRLELSEHGGPDGFAVLVGPNVSSDHTSSLQDGPLVVCIDGLEKSPPLIPAAKHWHALFHVPIWVVCRVTRHITGPYGTLLETGCAYRAAKAIASDASWEVVPDGPPAVAEFAGYIGAAAVMVAARAPGAGRHRRLDFAERVALAGSAVIVPSTAPAPDPWSPRPYLTLVR